MRVQERVTGANNILLQERIGKPDARPKVPEMRFDRVATVAAIRTSAVEFQNSRPSSRRRIRRRRVEERLAIENLFVRQPDIVTESQVESQMGRYAEVILYPPRVILESAAGGHYGILNDVGRIHRAYKVPGA